MNYPAKSFTANFGFLLFSQNFTVPSYFRKNVHIYSSISTKFISFPLFPQDLRLFAYFTLFCLPYFDLVAFYASCFRPTRSLLGYLCIIIPQWKSLRYITLDLPRLKCLLSGASHPETITFWIILRRTAAFENPVAGNEHQMEPGEQIISDQGRLGYWTRSAIMIPRIILQCRPMYRSPNVQLVFRANDTQANWYCSWCICSGTLRWWIVMPFRSFAFDRKKPL